MDKDELLHLSSALGYFFGDLVKYDKDFPTLGTIIRKLMSK